VLESPKDAAPVDEAGGHTDQRSATNLYVLVSRLRLTYIFAVGNVTTIRPSELASRRQGHHVRFQHHQKRGD
jgi:hypothetical protein